jgi:hypothetical protein
VRAHIHKHALILPSEVDSALANKMALSRDKLWLILSPPYQNTIKIALSCVRQAFVSWRVGNVIDLLLQLAEWNLPF